MFPLIFKLPPAPIPPPTINVPDVVLVDVVLFVKVKPPNLALPKVPKFAKPFVLARYGTPGNTFVLNNNVCVALSMPKNALFVNATFDVAVVL